jgi:hypothetical protein
MLYELSRATGLKLPLIHQNKETLDHQNAHYKYIYEDKRTAPLTTRGAKRPQIWEIRNNKKKRGNYIPTYTFTIFDGAGEDYENELDPTSDVCRYIATSRAIIITLDPLILSSIRRGGIVDPTVMKNSLAGSTGETKNAADIVNGLVNYIKQARGIKSTSLLKIPTAVVLTKFDTVINHGAFANNALIKKAGIPVKNGKVNLDELRAVDSEIRDWLYDIDEGAFIQTLESHFTDFCFFGVSSFGEPPVDAVNLNKNLHPHRVLDPILWLFKKADFID